MPVAAKHWPIGTNVAQELGMDRRDTNRRAELVQSVVNGVVRNPYAVITQDSLQAWLHIPQSVAKRILDRLVSAGLVREVEAGVWVRSEQV